MTAMRINIGMPKDNKSKYGRPCPNIIVSGDPLHVCKAAAVICLSPGIQLITFGNGTVRADYAPHIDKADLLKVAKKIEKLLEVS